MKWRLLVLKKCYWCYSYRHALVMISEDHVMKVMVIKVMLPHIVNGILAKLIFLTFQGHIYFFHQVSTFETMA